MSEQEPSIAYDPDRIAEALSADRVIHIGNVTPLEIFTGSVIGRINAAKAAQGEELQTPSVIESGLARLYACILPENIVKEKLSPHQHARIIEAIETVGEINGRLLAGAQTETVISALFDTYFRFQHDFADTSVGHILRVLGDDVAIERDFDLDRGWELYQDSLSRHERRS